jgi:hypothetical protein
LRNYYYYYVSSPSALQSGVPQGSALGPLLFNIFINVLCDVINNSKWLIFADDLKVYQAINSPDEYLFLQIDIYCVHDWFSANFMEFNFSRIRVISFTRKTNVLNYQYRRVLCS